jgi:hypothetical protein
MTTIYKLTDKDMQTHGGCKWEIGVAKETSGGGELCGPGWLHAYTSPLLAAFLNPIHGAFITPRLFEAEGHGECREDCGLKVGYTNVTLLHEILLPDVTTEQRITFGILCAMQVCRDEEFLLWAQEWLDGKDRTGEAAEAAEAAGEAAAADWAAGEAAAAAWAAGAAKAAEAARAAWASAMAAWASAMAAETAAWAASRVGGIDLSSIAMQAMKVGE